MCASLIRFFALRPSLACQVVKHWLSLRFTIAWPPPQACAGLYLRIAPATCAFTLRLPRPHPRAESSTLTLLTSWHLRTAFIISTFTLRLTATYSFTYITHINALAHCLYYKHLHNPLHYLPSHCHHQATSSLCLTTTYFRVAS